MMKNKKILILATSFLIIIGGFLIWYFLPSQPSFVVETDVVSPSTDQIEVINSFGYPDTFMLIMDQGVRYESWNYYDIERAFVFLDGGFFEEQTIPNLEEKKVAFPEFRPTQFGEDLLFSKIGEILGEPSAKGEINQDILENALVYNYMDQVSVGTKGDKVVFIQTFPVLVLENQ